MSSDDIQPGDHIYTDRLGSLYYHHGIYVGKAEVPYPNNKNKRKLIRHALIHFLGPRDHKHAKNKPRCKRCFYNNEDGVVLTCRFCFVEGEDSEVLRYDYGVSMLRFLSSRGSCYYRSSSPPDVVIKRAYDYYLGNQDFGEYDFLFNNCEHFATKCKTGKERCNQVPGSIIYNTTRRLTEGILWDK